jgi:hypothetical protein
MGKLFLIANIVLLLICGHSFYSLYEVINSEEERESKKIDYGIEPIKRPIVNTYSQYRNIFGFKVHDVGPTINAAEGSNKGGGLNELRDGALTLRVDGIFIAEGRSCAVISIKDVNSRKWDTKKIVIGDEIKGYYVTDIRPGSMSLKNSDASIITLRIFKRDET